MNRRLLLPVALLLPGAVAVAGGSAGSGLLSGIGISIIAAMVLAYLAHLLRQPLILAYIAAGVVIGPNIGLGLVSNEADINVSTDIGLILLLFMIGLEIDMKKLREAGAALITIGISQFLLCVALGIGFFSLLGFTMGSGRFDLAYLAVTCAISSTAIVVKLLYEKGELDTLAGRLTLGVLVFQDLWAIVVLGVQPNLSDPAVTDIALSFARGGALVVGSLLVSKYLLRHVFRHIAKMPEMVLVAALAWCFLVCAVAHGFGLSIEMGALIAGIALSTFPYNMDVVARIVTIRNFFLTLFFVSLGMKVPNPMHHPHLIGVAALASLFLIVSRFAAISPILSAMSKGNRVSLLVPINLGQISEFSLVIATLGVSLGHIGEDTLSIVIFVFVITSIVSTYFIQFSHPVQRVLGRGMQIVGVRDIRPEAETGQTEEGKRIALVGFFRIASAFLHEMERSGTEFSGTLAGKDRSRIRRDILVIDFNPEVYEGLSAQGVKILYGDVGNLDTLALSGITDTRLVLSTVPDTALRGTDNMTLLGELRRLCPSALVVVTAENPSQALALYDAGADYVLMPNLVTAQHLVFVVQLMLSGRHSVLRASDIAELQQRHEILA